MQYSNESGLANCQTDLIARPSIYPCMFQIKILSEADYGFAVELANTMDWNMAAEDFEFMASLEPGGCFLLLDDSKRVGIATCISYGKTGWFGNLIVEKEYRNRGAGTVLVTHAVNYLQAKGVETVGLYAYPNLTRFYGRLGFKYDEDFSVLHAQNLGSITAQPLPKITKQQLPAINRFDRGFFGGDRKKLLKSILLEEGNASGYVTNGGEVVGYAAATVYEKTAWVGPLICQPSRPDAALQLVKAVLAKLAEKSVYAAIPKRDAVLLDAFSGFGFREDFFVSRMFLGEANAKNCIYMAESLERG
jgi:GNAT superfamily N-acetyltransferase